MSNDSLPLVSVITPTYNHEDFIGPCIESILRQSYPRWEQIIIDDGSTDKTADVIRQYSDERIRYTFQSHRGIEGLAHTYNSALSHAKGKYLAILEGDDAWPPNKLSTLIPALADQDVVLAYGAVRDCAADGTLSKSLNRSVQQRWKLPQTILFNKPVTSATRYLARADGVDLIPESTAVIRRSTLESIGGFQYVPNLCVTSYPTFLKLSLEGNFYYTREVMGYRRRHLASATFQNLTRISNGSRDYAYKFLNENAVSLTAFERQAIDMTWQQSIYLKHFTLGRLCSANQQWGPARRHFQQALNLYLPRTFFASAAGWILAGFHCDLERAISWLGKARLTPALTHATDGSNANPIGTAFNSNSQRHKRFLSGARSDRFLFRGQVKKHPRDGDASEIFPHDLP